MGDRDEEEYWKLTQSRGKLAAACNHFLMFNRC